MTAFITYCFILLLSFFLFVFTGSDPVTRPFARDASVDFNCGGLLRDIKNMYRLLVHRSMEIWHVRLEISSKMLRSLLVGGSNTLVFALSLEVGLKGSGCDSWSSTYTIT